MATKTFTRLNINISTESEVCREGRPTVTQINLEDKFSKTHCESKHKLHQIDCNSRRNLIQETEASIIKPVVERIQREIIKTSVQTKLEKLSQKFYKKRNTITVGYPKIEIVKKEKSVKKERNYDILQNSRKTTSRPHNNVHISRPKILTCKARKSRDMTTRKERGIRVYETKQMFGVADLVKHEEAWRTTKGSRRKVRKERFKPDLANFSSLLDKWSQSKPKVEKEECSKDIIEDLSTRNFVPKLSSTKSMRSLSQLKPTKLSHKSKLLLVSRKPQLVFSGAQDYKTPSKLINLSRSTSSSPKMKSPEKDSLSVSKGKYFKTNIRKPGIREISLGLFSSRASLAPSVLIPSKHETVDDGIKPESFIITDD